MLAAESGDVPPLGDPSSDNLETLPLQRLQKWEIWKQTGVVPKPDEHGSWDWLPLLSLDSVIVTWEPVLLVAW